MQFAGALPPHPLKSSDSSEGGRNFRGVDRFPTQGTEVLVRGGLLFHGAAVSCLRGRRRGNARRHGVRFRISTTLARRH